MFRGVASVMFYNVRSVSRANISIVSYFFYSLGQIPKYAKPAHEYILSCMQKVYDVIFFFFEYNFCQILRKSSRGVTEVDI